MTTAITIADVASRAKVSISTVSHVLSGKRPISSAVRERVLRVVEETGYRPRHSARALAEGMTRQVGVVVYEIQNGETVYLLGCMEKELASRGYAMTLVVTGPDRDRVRESMREFSSGRADGVINMISFISVNEASALCPSVPVITYLRPHPESPVWVDLAGGTILMMEHLWSLGHRRIGYVCHVEDDVKDLSPDYGGNSAGLAGYRQFHTRVGAEMDPALVVRGETRFSDGANGAAALYARGATAIFCDNDVTAMGALNWAYDNRLHVPDDLTIVGGDDSPMALMSSPALTAVHFPAEKAAALTVQALLDRINGIPATNRQTVLDCRLVIRRSSGPPPTERTRGPQRSKED